DFPIIYASGVAGKAGPAHDLNEMKDIQPLFDAIVKYIPEPKVDTTKPLQMLTVTLAYDNYKGKIAIGRLYSGTLKKGMQVAHIDRDGNIKKGTLSSVMSFEGLGR